MNYVTSRLKSLTRQIYRIAVLIWIWSSLSCSIKLDILQEYPSELQVVSELKRTIKRLEVYQTRPTSRDLPWTSPVQIHQHDIRLSRQLYPLGLTESVLPTHSSTWMQTQISLPTLSGLTSTGTVGPTIKVKPDH